MERGRGRWSELSADDLTWYETACLNETIPRGGVTFNDLVGIRYIAQCYWRTEDGFGCICGFATPFGTSGDAHCYKAREFFYTMQCEDHHDYDCFGRHGALFHWNANGLLCEAWSDSAGVSLIRHGGCEFPHAVETHDAWDVLKQYHEDKGHEAVRFQDCAECNYLENYGFIVVGSDAGITEKKASLRQRTSVWL